MQQLLLLLLLHLHKHTHDAIISCPYTFLSHRWNVYRPVYHNELNGKTNDLVSVNNHSWRTTLYLHQTLSLRRTYTHWRTEQHCCDNYIYCTVCNFSLKSCFCWCYNNLGIESCRRSVVRWTLDDWSKMMGEIRKARTQSCHGTCERIIV